MKLVLFSQRQELVAPETQLTENMLCALLIREGNGATRHWPQLPSWEYGGRCRQICWCFTVTKANKVIELVVCEKGIELDLVQQLEQYMDETF